jgi:hypothetical protein
VGTILRLNFKFDTGSGNSQSLRREALPGGETRIHRPGIGAGPYVRRRTILQYIQHTSSLVPRRQRGSPFANKQAQSINQSNGCWFTPLFAPQYGGPFRASHRGSQQPTRRTRAHRPSSPGSTKINKQLYSLHATNTTVLLLRWLPYRAHQCCTNYPAHRVGLLQHFLHKLPYKIHICPDDPETPPMSPIRNQHTKYT